MFDIIKEFFKRIIKFFKRIINFFKRRAKKGHMDDVGILLIVFLIIYVILYFSNKNIPQEEAKEDKLPEEDE
tara:strand:+ start:593 stop:808 length:216 start_codon:yes stop_codon:yes gene_type:complete